LCPSSPPEFPTPLFPPLVFFLMFFLGSAYYLRDDYFFENSFFSLFPFGAGKAGLRWCVHQFWGNCPFLICRAPHALFFRFSPLCTVFSSVGQILSTHHGFVLFPFFCFPFFGEKKLFFPPLFFLAWPPSKFFFEKIWLHPHRGCWLAVPISYAPQPEFFK